MRTHSDVRLVIAGNLHRRDLVHGAWWPRSDDIVDELAPMLTRVSRRLPSLAGVTLNRSEWPGAPVPFQPLAVGSPKINWYGVAEPHSVVLHCGRFDLITLLVVPPVEAEEVALAAMVMAATPGTSLSATDTLLAARSRCARDGAH